MEPLHLPTSKINPADQSADPGKVSPLNRIAYATGLAQAAFGAAYSPPSHAEFVDRTPEAITALRLARWPGAMK